MRHGMIALALLGVVAVCSAADLSVGPYSYDPSYGAFPQPGCDACLPGVTPSLSQSFAVVAPPTIEAHPDLPWLKVRVNGRMTPLGGTVGVAKGQYMVPVTAAVEFGLVPTRDANNHRAITLTGGDKRVVITIGSRDLKLGPVTYQLPVAPLWMKGKAYMPVLSIGKLLGWRLEVDDKAGVLSIATQ